MAESGALLDTVARTAEATPGLVALYVFGSALRPSGAPPRDLDVAVVWDEELPAEERWKRGQALARRIEVATPQLPVDLIDLRDAPPALQHRVLSEGRRVTDAAPVARVRFEAETLSRALDFIEWQKPFLDRWLQRMADGR